MTVIDSRDLADCVIDGLGVCSDCHTAAAGVSQPQPCPCCDGVLVPILAAIVLGLAELEIDPESRSGPLIDRIMTAEYRRIFPGEAN